MPATDGPGLQGGYFGFELDNVQLGFFTSCSGLSSEVEVVELQQITANGKKVNVKQPGSKRTFAEVVLKRGFTKNRDLNDWFDATVDAGAAVERKTGSIVLYNREFTEVARWNLEQCFPSKLSVSDLKADGSEAVVEELTIRHEQLLWA